MGLRQWVGATGFGRQMKDAQILATEEAGHGQAADVSNTSKILLGRKDLSEKIKEEMTRDLLPYFPNFSMTPLLFLGG